MSRYQYKVITGWSADEFERLLNVEGTHGWRLGDFDIRTRTSGGTLFAAVLIKGGTE